ncbi:MAG TPA: hypothetical protein VGE97_07730 [Nitrososphaera sp.]
MNNWKQLGPTVITGGQTDSNVKVNVTGRITSIVIHPTDSNTIYVGTAQGGIWKTIDGGKHWSPRSDKAISLAIGALAIDPGNPHVLYAGTGEGNFSADSQYGMGIIKTKDGGQTWGLQPMSTFLSSRFCRIVVNPKNSNYIFAAATWPASGIYRSSDAGENWAKLGGGLPSSSNATDIVLDPSNPDIAYAAFWGVGIYKTTNANATSFDTYPDSGKGPTWNPLTGGLPSSGFTRIALGISPSSPQRLYALMSSPSTGNRDTSNLVNQFYFTIDSGRTWTSIPLPNAVAYQRTYPNSLGPQGSYNLNVAVDPTTPDIVYLSALSVWKAVRSSSGQWTFTNVGVPIHTDNHSFAFDPNNHLTIYAGNDGGIYRSTDGGNNWDDSINKGLCITQFEFMEQDLDNERRIIAGTQDNGTDIYQGKPEFYHAAGGDGGFVCVDPNQSQNVWHTFYNLTPTFSSQGGDYNSWGLLYDARSDDPTVNISKASSNFYPPMTLDKSNSNNIALGGLILYIDHSKGTEGWLDRVDLRLPKDKDAYGNETQDLISAINFVNSQLLYVGTNHGRVYCVTGTRNNWTAKAINGDPFPKRYVWDISTLPSDTSNKTIIVVVSGFEDPPRDGHVFRGVVSPQNDSATWTDISGTGTGRLPNIPVNALAIDENKPSTMYIGTDTGVFCTRDGGSNWMSFSRGLPTCQVYDLRLDSSRGLLRAATHGRGMWQWSNKTDPIVLLTNDGKLEAFWVHSDGFIHHKWQNAKSSSDSWSSGWPLLENLNEQFLFGTRPVIVRNPNGPLVIFWTYYFPGGCGCRYQTGMWQASTGKPAEFVPDNNWYGQSLSYDPVVSPTFGDPVLSRGTDGKYTIFFVASTLMHPRLFQITQGSTYISTQLHYTTLDPLHGGLTGPGPLGTGGYWSPNRRPTVAQNQDGSLDIFMMDMDNRLYHSWQTTKGDSSQSSWSNWVGLAGPLASEPAVASNDDGRLELFKIDAIDGKLYHRWQLRANDSSQWSNGWDPLNPPSLPRETPTVVRNGDGRLELFMVGMDDILYHGWQTTKNDSTNWSDSNWQKLAIISWPLSSSPVVANNEDGRLELFMVGPDGRLFHNWQTTKGDSSQWSRWDFLVE